MYNFVSLYATLLVTLFISVVIEMCDIYIYTIYLVHSICKKIENLTI